ncbi:PAS domain S-box protein [Crocosphaera sp.]|uniref:PAS domain S-box protein n=1 Tax=Crocosphaera sp. TaxID=2729996 RepID=UPI003F26E7DF|nr:PAS domain S-box protein [Crocosphaera sp.]
MIEILSLMIIFIILLIFLWQYYNFKKIRNQLEEEIIKRKNTDNKFQAIFNQTFQFIGLLDLEGKLLEANESSLNCVGVQAKDVIGQPFWETPWWSHSSNCQSQLKTAIKEAKEGKIIRFETLHFDKNKNKVYVDFSLKPVKNEVGEIIFLIPEGRDITSLKKTEKKFQKNQQELEAIFDILPDLFFRMKANSLILEYRGSPNSDLYVPPEVFLGKPMLEMLPSPVNKKWEKAISDVLKLNRVVSLKYSLPVAKGEEYYEARFVPFAEEEIITIVRNITQTQKAELELKKSKQFLQTIVDYLPIALFVKDGRADKFGQLLLVNKYCEELFGLDSSQVIGKTGYDLFPLEQARFYEKKDQQAFKKAVPEYIPEEIIDSYNKGRRTLRTVKVPLYDEQNNPEYLVCITEDITKEKKAERQLKKSYKLLQTISLAQSQFIADALPTILFNDLLENLLNLTESEYGFIGEILHNDQGQPYLEETHMKVRGNPYLKTHALTNIAWNEQTRKFYDKNAPHGMEFHNLKTLFGAVITTGKPVIANDPNHDPRRGGLPEGHPSLDAFLGLPFYHTNKLVGMVGIANRQGGYDQDLIDYLQPFLTTCANLIKGYRNERNRQQAEQEKEASENKLKALLTYSSDIVSIFDREGQLIYNSPAAEKIHGFSMEEMQQLHTFYLIHPDDRTRVGKIFSTLLYNPQKTITVQYRYQTKSKDYIWMETVASNQLDNPNIKGIVANSRDIRERKQAEEALRESEAKFRQLTENIHEVFWMLDLSKTDPSYQKSLYVSPAYQEVWGYNPEDIYENPQQWMEAIHPDDRQRIEQEFSQKLLEGEFDYQYRIIRPDGTLRWIRDRGFPVKNHTGEFVRVTGLAEDITEQKQREEEIKRLNQQLEERVAQRTAELEMLLNTLPDFVFVVERNTMKLLFCNQLFAQGIGFDHRQQVEGKTIFECFPAEMAAYFMRQNQQVFNSGETLHLEETVPLPEGDRYFDTYKVPLKDSQGEIYALLGTSRDMTELVKTKRVLMERTSQLEATNQELDSFCYSVSHDLRAPLRHIHGFVNALKQRLLGTDVMDDPKVIHYLEVIEKSSEKMAHLIDGLLTLSRVGRRELRFHEVDLNSVVKAAMNTVSSADQTIDFKVGMLPTVSGDSALLQQVFVNLLQNSIKFSRGQNPILIEINCLDDGTVCVADHGVGFDMQYIEQLFGAFQRLHSQKDFEGTGIGLSIVQRIIHRHGGQIWAESVLGEGATFYLKFP